MVMMIAVIIFRILITGTFALFGEIFSDYAVIDKSVKISVNSGFADSISLSSEMVSNIIGNHMMIFIFFQII